MPAKTIILQLLAVFSHAAEAEPVPRVRPPLGVMPWRLWWESADGDPTVGELLERYREVDAAVARHREAGVRPLPAWLDELGVR